MEEKDQHPRNETSHEPGLLHISEVVTNLRKREKVEVTCLDCGDMFLAMPMGRFTSSICTKCGDARNKRTEAREEQARLLQREQHMLSLIRLSGIPPKWRDTTFANSSPKINRTATKICLEYAENFSRKSPSLVLYSPTNGNGKTHLAACITNHLLHERGLSVMFKKARDLMLDIRRTFSDRESSEAELLDRVSYVDLLVLDDVGHDPASEWIFGTYWTVLDRRLEWQLPVVITTNKPFESTNPKQELLCDRIGVGAASRLMGLCQGNIIELVGPDLR